MEEQVLDLQEQKETRTVPLRILVADDRAAVRQSVRSLLQREGFEVVAEAGDGYEAIQGAARQVPDIAVIDLSMPGLDGIQSARRILITCPRTRVVLLTCHVQEHQIVRAFRAGVSAYVVKGEAAEHLAEAIKQVSLGKAFLSPAAKRVAADYVEEKNGVLSVRAS
jgi:DNA-binding NarL/FixJ family response regulator